MSLDRQILFSALGFIVVLMRPHASMDGEADKARSLAKMIELFCRDAVPEAFADDAQDGSTAGDNSVIDELIDSFKNELVTREQANLPQDRATLLLFYDRLNTRLMRREQRAFYETAPSDLIANRVLTLIDEEILRDEQSPRTV